MQVSRYFVDVGPAHVYIHVNRKGAPVIPKGFDGYQFFSLYLM